MYDGFGAPCVAGPEVYEPTMQLALTECAAARCLKRWGVGEVETQAVLMSHIDSHTCGAVRACARTGGSWRGKYSNMFELRRMGHALKGGVARTKMAKREQHPGVDRAVRYIRFQRI